MTKHEAAIVEAYTGITMLTGDDIGIFYEYVYKLLGHPILTHELLFYADKIKELSYPDFVNLCKNLKEGE